MKTGMKKRAGGYSLIEVLVAAAILGIAVAGVAGLASYGSKMNREDMLRRRAFQELEKVMESPQFSGTYPAVNTKYDGFKANCGNTIGTIFLVPDATLQPPLSAAPVLDNRGAGVVGDLDVSVTYLNYIVLTATVSAIRISATISWTDNGQIYPAEQLEKVITRVRG